MSVSPFSPFQNPLCRELVSLVCRLRILLHRVDFQRFASKRSSQVQSNSKEQFPEAEVDQDGESDVQLERVDVVVVGGDAGGGPDAQRCRRRPREEVRVPAPADGALCSLHGGQQQGQVPAEDEEGQRSRSVLDRGVKGRQGGRPPTPDDRTGRRRRTFDRQ